MSLVTYSLQQLYTKHYITFCNIWYVTKRHVRNNVLLEYHRPVLWFLFLRVILEQGNLYLLSLCAVDISPPMLSSLEPIRHGSINHFLLSSMLVISPLCGSAGIFRRPYTISRKYPKPDLLISLFSLPVLPLTLLSARTVSLNYYPTIHLSSTSKFPAYITISPPLKSL